MRVRGPHAHMNLTSVAKISNDVTDVTSAFQGIKLCVEVAVCIGNMTANFHNHTTLMTNNHHQMLSYLLP